MFNKDAIERIIRTAVAVFIGGGVAAIEDHFGFSFTGTVTGDTGVIATAITVVLAWVGQRVGDPSNASLLPAAGDKS